ncbi:NAD-dependent protein deacetylase [Achromobacter sp. NFACC18-2]|uniref:NAD-dependent protein deacetylase n=1 Tax=Achromobacter sp. NFACC18-2 TaxID=1564112 RepID=UPI0008B0130A|nr:NAD-dependent protein deacetylase [Achromobacter sp. NFACC18-2]SEJ90118.1 NAD-dependent protein deacetylase, SIR2 family [Achromobacter sp. NFACC18-2]
MDTAHSELAALRGFIDRHPRLFVLTGAGVSTDSGIPDYRDTDGEWKRQQPMTLQTFMGGELARSRYWARSMVGWRRFGQVRPNASHLALARLQARGHVSILVTQNVDGLHEAAGSHDVVDLHGRLDAVRCMNCDWRGGRHDWQDALHALNPDWMKFEASDAPDGDADLDGHDFSRFAVPPCPRCGGIVKPDVVFFGETVPRERVDRANAGLEGADAVLVVGSSLMVYSGYRFVTAASRNGIPIAAINLGRTRADSLLTLKVEQPCALALESL